MIFVTVGAQMPFTRLIQGVDRWAGSRGQTDVLAQIGSDRYQPVHMRWERFYDPKQFRQHMEQAELVVSHAGTGSIITGVQLNKPILVMPRHAKLAETRNDHQLATAKQFERFGYVKVAHDEDQLHAMLDNRDQIHPVGSGTEGVDPVDHGRDALNRAIRDFIDQTG